MVDGWIDTFLDRCMIHLIDDCINCIEFSFAEALQILKTSLLETEGVPSIKNCRCVVSTSELSVCCLQVRWITTMAASLRIHGSGMPSYNAEG